MDVKITSEELKTRQAWPLDRKVKWALHQIRIWYDVHYGKVYVAYSGGKDSAALLDLVRSLYPNVPAVFVFTGLQFPEIRKFVKTTDNVLWIKAKMQMPKVIEKHGYPIVSKENAQYIREIRAAIANENDPWFQQRMYGRRRDGSRTSFCLPKKWHFLIEAPFKISERCCDVMKKEPSRRYARETGRTAIIGTMATDSSLRKQQYLKWGCNAFDCKQPASRPLSIWTTKDVWQYIHENKIPYCRIYDMGYSRTGCIFCGFGAHLEKEPNRFQTLKKTHPKLWKYCMDKLGMRNVLQYVKVPIE